MRAVVVGSVESSRVAIEAIARTQEWTLPLVVSLPVELAHRHSDYVDLSAAAAAAGAGLLPAPNANTPEICEVIEAIAPDYIFVIGWSQICRIRLLKAARLGVIGYHPSPLPRMRGRAVIPWTILCSEPITAGTLFWIDAGVDTGPILEQRFFHVAPRETAETLYQRHMVALDAMMTDALAALAAGTPRREDQDERFATWAARRTPESGRIDWTMAATEIDRLVRASGWPYPGARTHARSRQDELIVWQARVAVDGDRHVARSGQVIARSDSSFVVRCGGGTALEITEWDGSGSGPPPLHALLGDSL
jgi:methionyl-tRNA formyltransferase